MVASAHDGAPPAARVGRAATGLRSGRWPGVVAGVIPILGGIVIFVLPLTALQTFTQVGGVLLVVVSVAGLLTLPIRSRGRA